MAADLVSCGLTTQESVVTLAGASTIAGSDTFHTQSVASIRSTLASDASSAALAAPIILHGAVSGDESSIDGGSQPVVRLSQSVNEFNEFFIEKQRSRGGSTRATFNGISPKAVIDAQRHGIPTSKTQTMPIVSDQEASAVAAQELRDFLQDKAGSPLRAWLRHFDVNNDGVVTANEFVYKMKRMDYQGNPAELFANLDTDNSGELSMEEIDSAQARMWKKFIDWCVNKFDGAEDMINKMCKVLSRKPAQSVFEASPPSVSSPRAQGIVSDGGSPTASSYRRGAMHSMPAWSGPMSQETPSFDHRQFSAAIRELGWNNGWGDILFSSLDIADSGQFGIQDLKWLEIEKKRQRRKELAKTRAAMETSKRVHKWKAAQLTLLDFKAFLKRRFGNYVRAWRCALSPDGNMVLQKTDLFKACTNIGWHGDVRLLYRAFDKDDSGYISIEELDARSAELLAHFRYFIERRFGNAAAAFRALDRTKTKKLRQPEFLSALRALGFLSASKLLFNGLDRGGSKILVEEDFLFLDRWKPPAFLVVGPNEEAGAEVKQLLLDQFKSYLCAWRHVLDLDGSNHCNYDEFAAACAKIRFTGDIAGAWRALDADLSGCISLAEIDPVSHDTLKVFKKWCDDEFGSVRSAFSLIDVSGDNEVTYKEFRRACRMYGYEGNVHTLFHALDVEMHGHLSRNKVAFLDEWDFREEEELQDDVVEKDQYFSQSGDSVMGPQHTGQQRNWMQLHLQSNTTSYMSDGPGPVYYLAPTMGAGPSAPTLHYSGSYSFRKREGGGCFLPGIAKNGMDVPSPCVYDAQTSARALAPSKPCWKFGTTPRDACSAAAPQTTPGPGAYSPLGGSSGMPAIGGLGGGSTSMDRCRGIACTPRRPLRLHPLQKIPT